MPDQMKHVTIIFLVIFVWQESQGQIYPDRHTTNAYDGWISCEKSNNPNPARGSSHWIRYDFGQTYALHDVVFWNMNHPDHLVNGLKNVLIEYSTNGSTWHFVDTFTVPKAPASGFYEGVQGPDLGGVNARYLLITAVDNHGGGCYGLSEFRVYTQPVNPSEFVLDFNPCESDGIYKNLTGGMNNGGTYSGPGVIDNGDETFDFDVAAVGPGTYTINYSAGNLSTDVTVLPCTDPGCPDCEACDPADLLNVPGNPIASNTYSAHKVLSAGRVSSSGNVEFKGFIDVELNPGFEVSQSGLFLVDLRQCYNNKMINHSFENDQDDWLLSNWQGGTANWYTETADPYLGNKAVRVVTSGTTGDVWRIQLRQIGHSITNGRTYGVSFYTKGTGASHFRFQVHLDEEPWTTYVNETISLQNHWTRHEFEFTADVTITDNVRVTCNLGELNGTYYFDEVKFFEK